MFCENCGFDNKQDSLFCEKCGFKQEASFVKLGNDDVPKDNIDLSGSNIQKDTNGALIWVYEYALWKNPVILFTVFKVLLLACSVPILLSFFFSLEDGLTEAITRTLTVSGICGAIIIGLLVISYPVVCFINGGKYNVLFRMDDKGVDHIQLKKQFRKAQVVGLVTALLGIAGNNFTAAGAGLLSATKQSQHTSFAKVKSVKTNDKRNTIYINETLVRNQIYAESQDYPIIKEFILHHCPKNAKISK